MTIHMGRRASKEGWTSFETDPHLRETKGRLYKRCLPCLTDLLDQLKAGGPRVELGMAWECWKVVAVVSDRDQGLELLHRFGEMYPDEYFYGKIGTGKGRRDTFAVMFHTESETRRDELHRMLKAAVDRCCPGSPVFYSRGCGDPYERLLGPWTSWEKVSEIRHRDRVEAVKADLRESLYGHS